MNTKLLLGLGIISLGLILMAKKASGSTGGKFTFGQPQIATAPRPSAPGWLVIIFDCDVYNENDVPIERALTIWYRSVDLDDPSNVTEWQPLFAPKYPEHSTQIISLEAGESDIYSYNGLDFEGSVFSMGSGREWTFRLQDALGNRSAGVTITT